jgi:hypothetical protein
MPLVIGSSLGPYQILAPLGAGGMSACGHARPRPAEPRASVNVSSRWGWGPSASERMQTPSPCR